jgi:tetratricopeptide (TPR) repeat protein
MLDTALADCDAAIAKKPDDTDYLESRALVLLRLGRFGDAVKAYDTALARRPLWAPALHGRSLAEAGLGETAKSRADQAALVHVDADIADEFDRMGVAVPGTAKSASITARSSH